MELPNSVFVYWAVFVDDFWELATRVGGQDDCLGEDGQCKSTDFNKPSGWMESGINDRSECDLSRGSVRYKSFRWFERERC